MTERLHFHFSLSCIREGNGNPLQCSCLENPRDGERGGLRSMGSNRVGHDWSNLAAAPAAACRWHHPYSRKWRGAKEPLDESEREEWKSWLKTQHSKNEDHGIWPHYFTANRWGNNGNGERLFSWAPKSLQMETAAMKLRCLLLGRKTLTNLDRI